MSLQNNDLFQIAYEKEGVTLYTLKDITQLHTERYIALTAQQIYANSGGNKDVFREIATQLLTMANDERDKAQLATNVGVLANNILYRLDYPVDEDCAIRMGALLTFMENENPDAVMDFYTQQKIELAHNNPELYTFFLTMGVVNIPEYNKAFDTLTDTEYFSNRRKALQKLTLPILKTVSMPTTIVS